MSADNKDFKRWVLLWLGDGFFIAVTAASGTALMILLVVLGHDLIRTGIAADWIASIANAVMAITAVFAFFVARSWLPQLTTQEGYKMAIRLVNEDVLSLGEDNLLKHNVHVAINKFTGLKEREQMVTGEMVLSELKDIYERADSQVRSIQTQMKKMATYGLAPAPARQAEFDAMMQALKAFASLAKSQWVLLMALTRGDFSEPKFGDLLEIDDYGLINTMAAGTAWTELSKDNLQELDTAWMRMTESQKAFLGTDSQIGKLFTVRW